MLYTGEQVNAYRALVIAKALELWANHRIKANRAYTPSAMLKAASGITGQSYKRGEYLKAASDIRKTVKAYSD